MRDSERRRYEALHGRHPPACTCVHCSQLRSRGTSIFSKFRWVSSRSRPHSSKPGGFSSSQRPALIALIFVLIILGAIAVTAFLR